MNTFKHILTTAIVVAGLAFAAGCQNVILDSAGKNIGTFNFGEFTGLLNTQAPAVTKATRDAMKQVGLVEVAFSERQFGSSFVAHDERGLEVRIVVEEVNSRQTALRVQWGKGGDLERSRQLYDLVNQATASVQTAGQRGGK